jgi:hypothetical protein
MKSLKSVNTEIYVQYEKKKEEEKLRRKKKAKCEESKYDSHSAE